MAFEVIHTPGETAGFDFAGAYFGELGRIQREQRHRDQVQAFKDQQLSDENTRALDSIFSANARADNAIAAANKRASDRLQYEKNKDAQSGYDVEALTKSFLDSMGVQSPSTDPTAPTGDAGGMNVDDPFGMRPPVADENAAVMHPTYGVPVRINKLPRTTAEMSIVLNAMRAQRQEEAKVADQQRKDAEKKARAAALMKAYGLDSALGFTDPTDVENFARHQQGGERLRIAEQRIRGAMGRRDLTPEQQNQLQNALAVLSDPNASPAEHSAAYIIAWQHQAAPLAAAVQKPQDPQRTAAAKVAWQRIQDLQRDIAAERKPRDEEKYYEDKLAARRDRVAAMEKQRQQLMADYEANFGRTPSALLPGRSPDEASPSMNDPATDGELEAALDALGDSASKEQLAQWISKQRSLGVR